MKRGKVFLQKKIHYSQYLFQNRKMDFTRASLEWFRVHDDRFSVGESEFKLQGNKQTCRFMVKDWGRESVYGKLESEHEV